MILQSDITPDLRVLSDRRHQLASMVEIPDMWKYSEDWYKLAADFRAIGYLTNAEKCDQRAEHYRAKAGPRQFPVAPYRYIFCGVCNGWKEHSLNITQDEYTCSICGTGNEVHSGGLAILDELMESK
jgi:hypothetical protein